MTCFGWARRCAFCVALCLGLCGCFPAADNQVDEKKEPHFITGKNLIGQMDWQGAIEEFEKALEVNPRSASAHFELGWLNEEKVSPPDPAAAVYHYEQFLKISPSPDKADLVRQHINTCKLELVKTMSAVGPLPSGAQRELERVVAENKDLQNQVAQLQAQITQLKAAGTAPQISNAGNGGGGTTVSHTTMPPRGSNDSVRTNTSHVTPGSTSGTSSTRVAHATSMKIHAVRPRETMASIARQYGVSLAALEAANPQVRPTHLQAGQTLKIPPS